MRSILFAAAVLAVSPAIAQTAPAVPAAPTTPAAPAAAAPAFTVADTDIGTLLDTPAAKAIVDKHLPGFSANPQIDMARSMTLAQVQQFSPENLTDAKLAAIDADLKKLPAK